MGDESKGGSNGPVREAPMSTILVVEDDPRIQKALERQFTMEGYTVHVSGDGAEGLATCKTLRPDGVVLDLMLPGMTGRDVCKGIKSWSILPYGDSNNADSKHYADQMVLYARGLYKTVLFGVENIKKGAVARVELTR